MSRYARTASSGDQSLLSAGDRTLQRGREAVVEPNGHIVVKRWKPRFSKNMPSRTMLSISVGELIQMPGGIPLRFLRRSPFRSADCADREAGR